jgi:hypothetical protein
MGLAGRKEAQPASSGHGQAGAARTGIAQNGEMSELGSQQLRALAKVGGLLERARISHWLFGGWGVDFHVGAVTRAHDDVDLAVWLEDVPRISELLKEEGWRHVPSEEDDGGTGFSRGPVRLELTFLVRDEDGRIVTPLRNGNALWPEGTFGDEVRTLESVRVRVVGLASLLQGKSSPREDSEDAAKDRADFSRLDRLRDTSAAARISPGDDSSN